MNKETLTTVVKSLLDSKKVNPAGLAMILESCTDLNRALAVLTDTFIWEPVGIQKTDEDGRKWTLTGQNPVKGYFQVISDQTKVYARSQEDFEAGKTSSYGGDGKLPFYLDKEDHREISSYTWESWRLCEI